MCYFIFGSVNVQNTDKTPGDFALGLHAKMILLRSVCSDPLFCRVLCVRTLYFAAFCVFGPFILLRSVCSDPLFCCVLCVRTLYFAAFCVFGPFILPRSVCSDPLFCCVLCVRTLTDEYNVANLPVDDCHVTVILSAIKLFCNEPATNMLTIASHISL